jgi:hypothetical protein
MNSGQRKSSGSDFVVRKKDNIIFIDFVLPSMINSIDDWYNRYFQSDYLNLISKAHIFHLVRFYDRGRFKNYKTLGKERYKFLEEVDLYVQMKRED